MGRLVLAEGRHSEAQLNVKLRVAEVGLGPMRTGRDE